MRKRSDKIIYYYDIQDNLTLINILTKKKSGELERIETYIGAEELGFSHVGTAKNLSSPGTVFHYSSYVKQQGSLLDYYIKIFEDNMGMRVHVNDDGKCWFEKINQ